MMNEINERRRFLDLLPWHVNGTLEPTERMWVEHYLTEHPDAQAELRWTERLQAHIQETAAPEVAPDVGFARFHALIRAEARAMPRTTRAEGGLSDRVRAFLAAWRLTPAVAVAATVIVAQTGIIGALLTTQMSGKEQELSTVRSVASGQMVSGPVLQVSFRADTPERELRTLLVSVGGTLVGGPGQLGNYLVAVPSEKLEKASQQLAASDLVEDVAVLANIPPRE